MVYVDIYQETHTHNYVLMVHTKRPSSCSAREENRMRSLVPFTFLPVLICVSSQVCACCIRAGWCVHVHRGNTRSAKEPGTKGMEL